MTFEVNLAVPWTCSAAVGLSVPMPTLDEMMSFPLRTVDSTSSPPSIDDRTNSDPSAGFLDRVVPSRLMVLPDKYISLKR